MSFRFMSHSKIEALRQAGFKGFPHSWHFNACSCCQRPDRVGMMFPPPPGVTTSQHRKNVSLALWAAGC